MIIRIIASDSDGRVVKIGAQIRNRQRSLSYAFHSAIDEWIKGYSPNI